MPSKNSVKPYLEEGVYHIYNRGVEKRDIFLDRGDYLVFLGYLRKYLSPPDIVDKLPPSHQMRLILKNLCHEVDLYAYCLMPNHFHLLIRQHTPDAMTKFLRRISTAYVGYFNDKYSRTGGLFQGKYKAVLVERDDYLMHLSKYIHTNSIGLQVEAPTTNQGDLNNQSHITTVGPENLITYPYSSYVNYTLQRTSTWVKTDEILKMFGKDGANPAERSKSYQSFVQSDQEVDSLDFPYLLLDNDLAE
jgi:putative transposase